MQEFTAERARLYVRQNVAPGTTLWWGRTPDRECWSFVPLRESDYPGLQAVKTLTVTAAHHENIPIVTLDEQRELAIVDLWGHGYLGLQVDPDGEVWEASFAGGDPRRSDAWDVPYEFV